MHEKNTSAFREGHSEGDGRKKLVVRIKHKPQKSKKKQAYRKCEWIRKKDEISREAKK